MASLAMRQGLTLTARLSRRRCLHLVSTARRTTPVAVQTCLNTDSSRHNSTAAAAAEGKEYPPKIAQLVKDISQLSLLEVADLIDMLKRDLNIKDAPVAAMPVMGAVAEAPAEEEQTEFTVKLTAFDAGSKAKLIKELKGIMGGMNLLEVKKFVESGPQILKQGITKEEAQQLKTTLEAVGGTITIE